MRPRIPLASLPSLAAAFGLFFSTAHAIPLSQSGIDCQTDTRQTTNGQICIPLNNVLFEDPTPDAPHRSFTDRLTAASSTVEVQEIFDQVLEAAALSMAGVLRETPDAGEILSRRSNYCRTASLTPSERFRCPLQFALNCTLTSGASACTTERGQVERIQWSELTRRRAVVTLAFLMYADWIALQGRNNGMAPFDSPHAVTNRFTEFLRAQFQPAPTSPPASNRPVVRQTARPSRSNGRPASTQTPPTRSTRPRRTSRPPATPPTASPSTGSHPSPSRTRPSSTRRNRPTPQTPATAPNQPVRPRPVSPPPTPGNVPAPITTQPQLSDAGTPPHTVPPAVEPPAPVLPPQVTPPAQVPPIADAGLPQPPPLQPGPAESSRPSEPGPQDAGASEQTADAAGPTPPAPSPIPLPASTDAGTERQAQQEPAPSSTPTGTPLPGGSAVRPLRGDLSRVVTDEPALRTAAQDAQTCPDLGNCQFSRALQAQTTLFISSLRNRSGGVTITNPAALVVARIVVAFQDLLSLPEVSWSTNTRPFLGWMRNQINGPLRNASRQVTAEGAAPASLSYAPSGEAIDQLLALVDQFYAVGNAPPNLMDSLANGVLTALTSRLGPLPRMDGQTTNFLRSSYERREAFSAAIRRILAEIDEKDPGSTRDFPAILRD